MKVKSESEDAQSCLTLSDPLDCSPPGFSVRGILQTKEYWSGVPPVNYKHIFMSFAEALSFPCPREHAKHGFGQDRSTLSLSMIPLLSEGVSLVSSAVQKILEDRSCVLCSSLYFSLQSYFLLQSPAECWIYTRCSVKSGNWLQCLTIRKKVLSLL